MTPRDQRTPEEMQNIAEESDMSHISTLVQDELNRLRDDEVESEAA
jgi:hypothetical protein